jgi:hypothetical protein
MKAIGHVEIQDQMEATRYPKILPLDFKIKANRHPKPAGIFTSPRKKNLDGSYPSLRSDRNYPSLRICLIG